MKGQQKVVFCRRYIPARMFPSFISQIAHSIPSKFYEKLRFSDRSFSYYSSFTYNAYGILYVHYLIFILFRQIRIHTCPKSIAE